MLFGNPGPLQGNLPLSLSLSTPPNKQHHLSKHYQAVSDISLLQVDSYSNKTYTYTHHTSTNYTYIVRQRTHRLLLVLLGGGVACSQPVAA